MKRNGTIDFFKFIFTLVIVLFHMNPLYNTEDRVLFGCGRIAVEFFFIVSGYLLTEKAANKPCSCGIFQENIHMLKGKILRMFPYLMVAVVCGCVFYSFPDFTVKSISEKLIFSLSDVFGLQMLGYPFFAATGVAWYLSVLFFVSFLVFPILLWKRELFTKYLGPISAVFVLGYIAKTSGGLSDPGAWWGWTFKGMLRGYADMALGCATYEIVAFFNGQESGGKIRHGILEVAGYAITIGYAVIHKDSDRYDFLIIPLLLLSISLSFSNKSVLSGIFQYPFFNKLGIFSMSVYLNHYYVVQSFLRGVFPVETVSEKLLLCGGIIAGLSFMNFILGKVLAKWINRGERMIYVTLGFAFFAAALHFLSN